MLDESIEHTHFRGFYVIVFFGLEFGSWMNKTKIGDGHSCVWYDHTHTIRTRLYFSAYVRIMDKQKSVMIRTAFGTAQHSQNLA